jgi:hypothetical protein
LIEDYFLIGNRVLELAWQLRYASAAPPARLYFGALCSVAPRVKVNDFSDLSPDAGAIGRSRG